MKKMLLKFADNLLSKDQMKQVKGGVFCEIWLDGVLSIGPCAANDSNVCGEYAYNYCRNLLDAGLYLDCSYRCG